MSSREALQPPLRQASENSVKLRATDQSIQTAIVSSAGGGRHTQRRIRSGRSETVGLLKRGLRGSWRAHLQTTLLQIKHGD